MTGFAIDGNSMAEVLADFRNVRGNCDTDPQLAAVRGTVDKVMQLIDELESSL